MRKLILSSLFLGTLFSSVFSVSALTCTDLQSNLKKGNETKNVLALQNFLSEKQFLTAKPNGYFGVGTQKAVILYQKNKGIPSTGAVFAMTRDAIRKDSCETSSAKPISIKQETTSTWSSPNVVTTTSTTTNTSTKTTGPTPTVSSVDKGIVFINGDTDWQINITGTNFATTTNIVYLQNRKTLKRYLVGTLPSPDKTKITLPKSLGTRVMSCGTTCVKLLEPGEYLIVVETKEGGESYTSPTGAYIVVRDLQSTSGTQTTYKAIPYAATSTKLGVCNFIAYTPTTVSLLTFNVNQGNSTTTTLSKIIFKDEATGQTLSNDGVGQKMYEGQYLTIGVYANVINFSTTTVTKTASCTLTLTDINSKTSSITSPPFSLSFDPEPTYITDVRNKKSAPEIRLVDAVTVITNGTTTWGVNVYGSGFSSTTNTVYLASRKNTKKYLVEVLPSTDNRQTVTLPLSLGTRTMSCGIGCEETLPPGDYDLTVTNEYGESNQKQLQVKSFTTSATTGTLYKPFDKQVTGARLGTVNIGVGAPLKVSSITALTKFEKNTSTISGIYLKDEATGVKLVANGKDMTLGENDSKTFGVYGDIITTVTTRADVTVAFDVIDYLGNKHTIISSPSFTISLTGNQ